MKEDIIHSLIHEFIHAYLRKLIFNPNSIASEICFAENSNNPQEIEALRDYEEILVNHTMSKYLKEKKGISIEIIQYYDDVEFYLRKKVREDKIKYFRNKFQKFSDYNLDDSLNILENLNLCQKQSSSAFIRVHRR